jgi:hypothetical protein
MRLPTEEHGAGRYIRGCRCETCTDANTEAQRLRRAARRAALRPVPRAVSLKASAGGNGGRA